MHSQLALIKIKPYTCCILFNKLKFLNMKDVSNVQSSAVVVELGMGQLLSKGFVWGLKNFLSLLGASLLWMLTIWIPYVNVGTTIALFSLPVEMSKGKAVNPLAIFDGRYRKNMGEFFLWAGLYNMILGPAYVFAIIPGLILSYSYSMSLYILLDKELSPSEALSQSNKITHGYKWSLFAAKVISFLPFPLFLVIPEVGPYLFSIYYILYFPFYLGLEAYSYAQLSKRLS